MNFKKLLLLLLCFVATSHFTVASKEYLPRNLLLSKDLKNIKITDQNDTPLDIGMSCSLTLKNKDHLIFCNYMNLYIMNLNTGKTIILEKPENVNSWFPTGVKWNEINQKLYVANYLGNDILVFKFDKKNNIILEKRYTDVDLLGPENIDVLDKGNFVVADFDNSKVIFFDKKGKLWSKKVREAHGVSFTQDKKFILVSSLTDKKIYKFDLQGNLVNEVGKLGWVEDSYMWPTSITSSTQGSCVCDAHTGKITFFDDNLVTQKIIGGNGLGVDLFNMPYGITWSDDKLIVADTFKRRILKINPQTNEIISIYQGYDKKPSNELNWSQKSPVDHLSPLGLTYDNYINLSEKTEIKLNGLELNGLFNSGYNSLVSHDVTLSFDLTINSFTSGIYYWTFAKNFKFNNLDFTIIGSPQVSEWLLIHKGITYSINIGEDFWLDNEYLVSSEGVVVPLTEIASAGLLKIRSYIQEVQQGKNVFKAIQKYLFSFPQIVSSVHGEKGKKFIKNLIAAENIQEQQKVARLFLESIKQDKIVYFVDIAIASMVLYDFNNNSPAIPNMTYNG